MKLHIFVETGIPTAKKNNKQYTNEWHFIQQYIKHLCSTLTDGDIDIIDVGGKDKLAFFDNQMRDYTRNGDKNLVIFDCFLFPNNQDEGAFEDLLLQIINPKHQGIVDCFSRYEQCVGGQNEAMGGNCYEMPNIKAKVYIYITAFKRNKGDANKVKNGDWNFCNVEYWDLDHAYLMPLKSFLEKYL